MVGRPRIYLTPEERAEARRAQTREHVRAHRRRRAAANLLACTTRQRAGGVVARCTNIKQEEEEQNEDTKLFTDSSAAVTISGSHFLPFCATDSPITTPIDFPAFSRLSPIEVSFSALRQLVTDMHQRRADQRFPRFPWLKVLIDTEHSVTENNWEIQLLNAAAFSTAAQRIGTLRGDSGLLHLAMEGRHFLLRGLRKHVGSGNADLMSGRNKRSAHGMMALFLANEALTVMCLFDQVVARVKGQASELRIKFNCLKREGFAIMRYAGAAAYYNEVGWWITRSVFSRVMWTALIDRKTCFLDDPLWLITSLRPRSSTYSDDNNSFDGYEHVNTFWMLNAKVPRFMEQADRLVRKPRIFSRVAPVIVLYREVIELRTHMHDWWLRCRKTLPTPPWSTERLAPTWIVGKDVGNLVSLFPISIWFADRRSAGACVAYWMYSILLVMLMEQLRPHLPDTYATPDPTLSSLEFDEFPAQPFLKALRSSTDLLAFGEKCARCLCGSTQYMLESLDVDDDPGAYLGSDMPHAPLYIAESFFSLWPDKFVRELCWIRAAYGTLRNRTLMSAISIMIHDEWRQEKETGDV